MTYDNVFQQILHVLLSKKEVTNQDPSDALTPAQTGGNTEINYSHSGHSATWPDTAQSCLDGIKDKPKVVHKGILKMVKHYGKLTAQEQRIVVHHVTNKVHYLVHPRSYRVHLDIMGQEEEKGCIVNHVMFKRHTLGQH